MERRGKRGQVLIAAGLQEASHAHVEIPQEWVGKRLVIVPEDELVLLAHNRHVKSSGKPPALTIDSGDRAAYFENEHGEQWVLVHRAETGETYLHGGDAGWPDRIRIVRYRGEVTTPDNILNDSELQWLNLVIREGSIPLKPWRPTAQQRGSWETWKALRYYAPNMLAAGAPIMRVFISSPSDLRLERRLVARTVLELGHEMGLPLRPMLWEGGQVGKSYIPPFPAEIVGSAPQSIIDEHLFNRIGGYDVYVGLAWSRMGTRTGEFRSGTEAELRAAQAQNSTSGRPSKILFYNKTAPIPPRAIDIAQLRNVRAFVKAIRREGLVHDFGSQASLRQMLRAHLAEAILSLTKTDALWKRLQTDLRLNASTKALEPNPIETAPGKLQE